jgi:predicted phage tail protein
VTDPKILAQKEALDAFAVMLGGKTTEAMAAQLKPMFEGMTNAMTAMSENMKSFAEKMVKFEPQKDANTETKTEDKKTEKVETTKAADKPAPSGYQDMLGTLQTLMHGMNEIKKTADDAKKTSQEIAKSVSNETVREEKIERPAKDKEDQNAVFDTIWPFTKKS